MRLGMTDGSKDGRKAGGSIHQTLLYVLADSHLGFCVRCVGGTPMLNFGISAFSYD